MSEKNMSLGGFTSEEKKEISDIGGNHQVQLL